MLVCREDFDSIQEITKFKTSADWGADPMKAVETKTKSAFTRSFNQAGLPVRTSIMVEDAKKGRKPRAAAAPVDDGSEAFGGELADVRLLYSLEPLNCPSLNSHIRKQHQSALHVFCIGIVSGRGREERQEARAAPRACGRRRGGLSG
jgi:hypothetical protein